jgi:ureidoglycolate lyase
MRTVGITELSKDAFQPFGSYADMLDPKRDNPRPGPIGFFPDMVQLDLGGVSFASFSTCRVEPRERVIRVVETHAVTGEGILPIDNDVLIHVVPPSPAGAAIPLDEIQVFRVPRGTMVTLLPGVWHHAPFTIDDNPANVLIVLPERTYANDCQVVKLDEDAVSIQA